MGFTKHGGVKLGGLPVSSTILDPSAGRQASARGRD